MLEKIYVKGARENNLKNIDVEIPRDKLVVITGISGSGKSSLAFDTIYAEGQRRYIESLSSYARMFLGQMDKPDVDYIDGLSPAISIDQKTTSKNPRSTVGTATEIYDYLRLLWARIGVPHCPQCGKPIQKQSIDQIVDSIAALDEGTRYMILSPIVKGRKGEHSKVLDEVRKAGFVRAEIDGEIFELSEEIKLEKNKKHDINIVVDRLIAKNGITRRIADSCETALSLGDGLMYVRLSASGELLAFSQSFACTDCGISIEEISPRLFSFNNPHGACPMCGGLGVRLVIDPDLIIPDKSLSLLEGAIRATGWNSIGNDTIAFMYYSALAEKYSFKLTDPVSQFPPEALEAILYGTKGQPLELRYEKAKGFGIQKREFEGIINNLLRRHSETQSAASRAEIEECMVESECPMCKGKRLKNVALAVKVGGLGISEFTDLSVNDAVDFISALELSEHDRIIASQILREISARLDFLKSVGLSYLCLSRKSATLSGGESQRIRLATQIGSGLVGVLYVLDEPSIGLHQRDNAKLIATLRKLRDQGNTLLVVEHDEETMRAADYIIDVGPGAGSAGGEIVCSGSYKEICTCPDSITAAYLRGDLSIPIPTSRRKGNGKKITVRGAAENNLKSIDVSFPLATMICVTGVSGSGKSSLVNEILYKILVSEKNMAKCRPGKYSAVEGLDFVDKVILLDQSPIGRTPRSNPATYTGVFSDIRALFATSKEARMRGYSQSRFSFNVKGGRCESCKGDGLVKIEMHFLSDVFVPCEVCEGKRYNRETLEVKYKGKNIADILDMTVEEAVVFFANQKKIYEKLQTLYSVGLGYIKLGQSSTTLSGGEAQRVKLASELSKRSTGKTVYILDEPTTGLHAADVHRLSDILNALVDSGNTVIVIEHNLDIIKNSDYIIDLGPEGGDNGGKLIFAGTPEDCANCEASYTGHYLKILFEKK